MIVVATLTHGRFHVKIPSYLAEEKILDNLVESANKNRLVTISLDSEYHTENVIVIPATDIKEIVLK